jgi:hypothetical protein
MKTYSETYVVFDAAEADAKEREYKVMPESRFKKQFEKTTPPETLLAQTFQFTEVESPEDATALFGPDVLNVINRGGVLKQQRIVRDLMLDTDESEALSFDAVEGVYDLAPACAELTERKAATPIEKAAKSLSKLSPAELADLLARFTGAAATA